MQAFGRKKPDRNEDSFFAVKSTRQKLLRSYAEVTPLMGILLISAHILDHFPKLKSYRMCDTGMDINPEHDTSYPAQKQEAFLKYVENENWAKHECVPVMDPECVPSSNLIPSAMASGYSQSFFDPYDLSSNDGEYWTRNNVGEMTPGWSDRAALLSLAARHYFNSPPKAPKNWRHVILIWNITTPTQWKVQAYCGHRTQPTGGANQRKHTHSTLISPNVAPSIFSIIPDGVRVEAIISLCQDGIGKRQSCTTGVTPREKFVKIQFTWANHAMLAGHDPTLDRANTENESRMKYHAVEWTLHRMANVHDILEMWQGSQNLRAAHKESRDQNNQMKVVGYMLDTEEIINASF